MDTISEFNTLLNNLMFDELEEIFDKMPYQKVEGILNQLVIDSNTGKHNLLV